MNDDLLIGLDLGTSSIKGILVSTDGEILSEGKVENERECPEPGYCEYSADEHYENVCSLIRELAGNVPEDCSVRTLSMAAASGNTLLADRDGIPLTPVISWMDERIRDDWEEFLPCLEAERVHETVGWPFSGGFPLAHLAWLRRYHTKEWSHTSHFCMNTDWLNFKLSGKWGMDHSTATTFFLQDQKAGEWYPPFLEMLGIKKECLSELLPSGTCIGTITEEACADTGLGMDTKVVLGAFDHPCAARGTGTLEEGHLLLSCGTSWVGFYPAKNRESIISENLLCDPFLQPAGPWGAIFSIPRIGITIDRYVEMVSDGCLDYELFSSLAEESPAGANGCVIDLASGEMDDTQLSSHTREDLARGVMESAAHLMKVRIIELAGIGMTAQKITMVGGPAESPVWPQIVADITGLELELVNGQTAGALGAAMLAGIGAGLFADEREAFEALRQETRKVTPKV